jgi:putative ABC transport system permease protein
MRKIFLLAFANIRKTKGHTVSLFLMFFIAALLLNAGLLISVNFGSYFDHTTKELNSPNNYYIMPNRLYTDEVDRYITENKNVIDTQKEEPYWASAETMYDGELRGRTFLFQNADQERNMARWKFVGEHLPAEEMSIYLPYLFKLSGGYQLNDPIEMVFDDGTKISFTVKGFIEDVFFSSPETGLMGVYLPDTTFEKVAAKLGDTCKATLVFVELKEVNKEVETGIRDLIEEDKVSPITDITGTLFSIDMPLIKLSRTMMAIMVSIMIVAFAAIIALVCLIVVRFRINNSIEDDMTKIGSLKAIGYTSHQIIWSIVTQFVMIAFVGSIVGIALSYRSVPILSDVFAQQSGLLWTQGFDATISGIALFTILLIVGMVAFVSSGRIRRLHPIIALRGGIVTHSFRKNHMPLDRSRGSLPVVFAFKSILQNKKQSIMIAFILVAVSFAQTFAVVMFYNTTVDKKAFYETPGVELSNAIAVFKPEADQTAIEGEIRNLEEVRKQQYIDEALVEVDTNEVSVYVMEDYSGKETDSVYKGRYPIHDNEIVLAGHLADMLGKTVGDNVEVKMGENKAQYIVTGLSQGAYMGGMNSSVTLDGILKLNPDFKQSNLNIYLKDGEDAGAFVKKLDTQYKDSFLYTMDMDKNMELGAGVYITIVSKVGIAILTITLAVVILVLYFVINSSVVRRKRELGIQKAIGFTTLQLMNQLSLSFLPPIILGVCIGSILGITQTNVIMTVAQSGMGISKANFIITPGIITLFGAAIVIISYFTSLLITYRIRRISAYALVTE